IPVMRVAVEPALVWTKLVHQFRLRGWLLAVVKQRFAHRLRVSELARSVASPDVYFGTAHAGGIDAGVMDLFIADASRDGVVEIGMHPGYEDYAIRPHEIDDGWFDPLGLLRPQELDLLQSTALAERLAEHGATLGRLSQLGKIAYKRAA